MGAVDESVLLELMGRIYAAAAMPEHGPGLTDAIVRGRGLGTEAVARWLHAFASGSACFDRLTHPETRLALCHLLMPHLQRAMALQQQLAAARLPGLAALASLDLLPMAVWLLRDDGALLYANSAAVCLTQRGDVLVAGQDGRPHACLPMEDRHLQHLMDDALQAGQGASGTMLMLGGNGSGALHVMVSPLSPAEGGAAAVFATDPNRLPPDMENRLRRFYEMTPAEARLATALVAGEPVKAFAERLGVAEETARTHLKHILAKTGARRQSDLVRIVVTGPAMLGCETEMAKSP